MTDKPTKLAEAGEIQAGWADFIETHTDPDTGELTASEDELKVQFGADEVSEQKLISLSRMRAEEEHRIELIDQEIAETEKHIHQVAGFWINKMNNLDKKKGTIRRKISWFEFLVHQYLKVSKKAKFDLGVTKAHIKHSSSVEVDESIADLSKWPKDLTRVKFEPDKKKLKALEPKDLPKGVTVVPSETCVWKSS